MAAGGVSQISAIPLSHRAPDALSFARIPLSLLLPVTAGRPLLCLIILGAVVLTDVLDGWLARRLAVSSARGARLDTWANTVAYPMMLLAAALSVPLPTSPWLPAVGILAAILLITTVKCAALGIARRRFGRWAGVHTWGSKAAGALVIVNVASAIWLRELVPALVWSTLALAFAAAVEEAAVLATTKQHDPNRPGIWASSKEEQPSLTA